MSTLAGFPVGYREEEVFGCVDSLLFCESLFCEEFLNLFFDWIKFKSFSRFLNSRSNISMSKDLFKVQKLTKSVKFMTSLNTGQMVSFKMN